MNITAICKDCGNGTLNGRLNPQFELENGTVFCLRCYSCHVDVVSVEFDHPFADGIDVVEEDDPFADCFEDEDENSQTRIGFELDADDENELRWSQDTERVAE